MRALDIMTSPVVTATRPREQAARYVKEHGHLVGDVMCDQVISISDDMLLNEIADLMERRHLKRVPVLTDG